jgi:AcrR family transcriptional regulator
MARQRLSPDDRRAQLLDLGAELFASLPYDEVHIERVAEQAGVSRGLLYHYFPNKRSFFAELVRRATAAMAADTEPQADLAPLEQLTAGVQRYLEHVRRHRQATRAVMRGAASADGEIQLIIDASTRLFENRIIDVLEPGGAAAPLLRVAVRTWVQLMRAAGQELLDHPDISIEHVRDLCVSAFLGLMGALPHDARPARVDEVLRGLQV